ncbi:MAG: hypothetical protein JXR25_09700 [Pontiellaceae bacterium]|nr:hypothetical protein [Pontiellaceae bacterium]MBN2785091.1 hypothetical protein [Pontiellaceae bacterium]
MPYILEIDKDAKAVRAKAIEKLSQSARISLILEVSTQLKMNRYSRALLDLNKSTFSDAEPMTSALELINCFRMLEISQDTQLALIHSSVNEHQQYFESAARFDGWNLRYFPDENAALEWFDTAE